MLSLAGGREEEPWRFVRRACESFARRVWKLCAARVKEGQGHCAHHGAAALTKAMLASHGTRDTWRQQKPVAK